MDMRHKLYHTLLSHHPGSQSKTLRTSTWFDNMKTPGKNKILPKSMARNRKTYRRPRRSRRSRRWGRRRALVAPKSIVRRLPTSFYNSIDAGSGVLGYYIVTLNSAYDPTGTASASLQGMGMDQYEALYNKYCVVGYKLHFQFVTTDNTNPITVGFTPTTTSSVLASQHAYIEQPGTVFKVMTSDIDKVTLTVKGSCKRWLLPRGGKLLTDDTFSALVSADPSRKLYGHVWAQAQDGAADPSKVQMTVKMEQIVVFYDPKTPSRSTQ